MANVSSSNGLEKRLKLRFPGFDEPWRESSFDELGSFYNGLSGKSKDDFGQGSDRFITYMNVYKNTIATPDGCELVLVEDGEHQNRVEYGDILFTQSSETLEEVGLSSVWLHKASPFLNSFCFGFHFAEKGMINPRFIAYSLRTSYMREKIIREGQGATRYNLSSNRLKPIKLVYPSYQEQSRIANLMSHLEKRIEKQQELICTLKKYKRGAVSRLLNGTLTFNDCSDTESWQLRRVGDFCEVQMCKRVFKEQTTPDGDVPFYKIGTIGGLPDAYISRFLYEDYKRKYSFPRKGEFLISCAGTVGKCVLYNGEDAYYQDSNLVWLRNNSPDVFNDYLFVLVSNVDWTTLNSTTITRIYNDNLRDLRFYIPPMQIQKRIVDYIFTLSSRIDIEQMTLDKLQQERMGLLQQLFI